MAISDTFTRDFGSIKSKEETITLTGSGIKFIFDGARLGLSSSADILQIADVVVSRCCNNGALRARLRSPIAK